MASIQDLLKKVRKSIEDTANSTVLSSQWRSNAVQKVQEAAPTISKVARNPIGFVADKAINKVANTEYTQPFGDRQRARVGDTVKDWSTNAPQQFENSINRGFEMMPKPVRALKAPVNAMVTQPGKAFTQAGVTPFNTGRSNLQKVGDVLGGVGAYRTMVSGPASWAAAQVPAAMNAGIKMAENRAQGKRVGEGVGDAYNKGLQSGFQIRGFTQFSNPVINKFVKSGPVVKLLKKVPGSTIAANRITPAVANVVEGVGIDKTMGSPTTPLSMGIDAVTGFIAGPSQFDAPTIGKGVERQRSRMHPQDASAVDAVIDTLRNKKASSQDREKALLTLDRLADHYLTKSEITTLRDSQQSLNAKDLRIAQELQKRAGDAVDFSGYRIGLVSNKNGKLQFDGNYQKGDIKSLQNELDEILGTKSFATSNKWQANLPARNTAKKQLEYFAESDPEARELVDYVNRLEDDIATAQAAKTTPAQRVPLQKPNKSIDDVLDEMETRPGYFGNTPAQEPLSISTPKQIMEQRGGVPAVGKFNPNDPMSPGYATLKGYDDLYKRGYSKAQLDKMGPNDVRKALAENLPPEHPSLIRMQEDYPALSRAPQIGNTPVKVGPRRYQQYAPTDEEVSQTVGQSLVGEVEDNGVKRWFNKVFDPLKNAPKQVQDIMQGWRNENILARTKANEVAQMFTDIPEKDGWKLVQYIQNPTNRNAMELGIDPDQYTPQIKRLREFYDTTRQQGIDSGLDVKYLDNYLNQIWKETPDQIDAKIKAGAGGTPGWVKERRIPSYQEGVAVGLTPRFTHPAQLAAHYKLQLDKALSNQKMVDDLIGTGLLLPAGSAPSDWKTIESPFFPKVTVKMGSGEDIVTDYKAPPDIARAINNIFEVREPGLLTHVANISKATQEFALSAGIPFTPVNSFVLANLQKEVMAGRVRGPVTATVLSFSDNATANYFRNNQQTLEDMASEGIATFTNTDYASMYKNMAESTGFWGRAKDLFNSAFNEVTFKRFMPILQVEFYKDAYTNAAKTMDPAEARRVAAEATRNFNGLTDAFSRPGQTDEVLSSFMMAPRFREAMVNFWGNTLKSLDPRTFADPAFAANRKFVVGAALTWGLYNILNYQQTGRFMHENKDGKELSLEIPMGNGRSFYLPFLFTIGTVPRRFMEAGGELVGGDIAGAAQKFASFASIPVNAAMTTLTNRNFYGAPISNEDDPALAKAGKQIAAGVGQMMHPWIRTGIELGTGQRTLQEALPGMLEVPLYPSSSSDVAHLKGASAAKYKELNAINPEMATAYAQQQKTTQEANELIKQQKKAIESAGNANESKGFWGWMGSLLGGEEKLTATDIAQLDISDKDKKSLIKQKLELEQPLTTDEYMIHFDLNKYAKTPDDPIQATRQEADRYKAALNVYRNEELSDQVKSDLISKLDISEGDIAYYDIASDSTRAVRRIFTEQYLLGIEPNQDRVEFLSTLRREVRGERVLTDTVIDELVDYGHITQAEGKLLKNIVWDDAKGQLVPKKGKGKKLSIKLTKLSTVGNSGGSRSVAKMPTPTFSFGNGGSGVDGRSRQSVSLTPPQRRQLPKIKLKTMTSPIIRLAPIQYQPQRERRLA